MKRPEEKKTKSRGQKAEGRKYRKDHGQQMKDYQSIIHDLPAGKGRFTIDHSRF